MVARKEDAERATPGRADDLFPRVFTTWRALLGRAGRAISVAVHPSDETRIRRRAHLEAAAPFAAGGMCMLVGVALGVALAGPTAAQRGAWIAGLSTIVWAFGRLLVLELTLQHALTRKDVMRPWAWGLVPYALAVTPLLTVAAWILSAAVTVRLLIRQGISRPLALRAAAFAWGTQAVFVGVAWLIVNGWVAFLATR